MYPKLQCIPSYLKYQTLLFIELILPLPMTPIYPFINQATDTRNVFRGIVEKHKNPAATRHKERSPGLTSYTHKGKQPNHSLRTHLVDSADTFPPKLSSSNGSLSSMSRCPTTSALSTSILNGTSIRTGGRGLLRSSAVIFLACPGLNSTLPRGTWEDTDSMSSVCRKLERDASLSFLARSARGSVTSRREEPVEPISCGM